MKINIDKKKSLHALSNVVYPLIAFGLVMSIWAIMAKVKNNPLLLPMPDVVIDKFFTLCKEEYFWESVLNTLWRTIYCFLISFVVALFLASISAIFAPLNKILSPIVAFLRSAPTVAVILVLYAFFDNGTLATIVGFLIAFPILYNSIYGAIVGVDKKLIDMGKLYKLNNFDIVFKIYLPEITPTLFNTSKATLSLTLKVIIASEILTFVPRTIGMKIETASASFDVVYLLAWTLIAIVFSFVLEAIVSIFKKVWEVRR